MESQSRPSLRRFYAVTIISVLLIWGAVAFDYYDRRRAEPEEIRLEEWGVRPKSIAYVVVPTGTLVSSAESRHLTLAVRVYDPQVEETYDQTIEKSGPFLITGGPVYIEVVTSDAFLSHLGVSGVIQYFVLLLPQTISPEQIRSLNDVRVLGGWVVGRTSQALARQ